MKNAKKSFKWCYIIGGLILFIFLIIKLESNSAEGSEYPLISYMTHNYKPILVYPNMLMCPYPDDLEKGIKYRQERNMKEFNLLLSNDTQCALTTGIFKAFLVDEYNDIELPYSLIYVELEKEGEFVLDSRYYHISKSAYSNWPENWREF